MPSSLAARNTRMAISPRLATMIFLNGLMADFSSADVGFDAVSGDALVTGEVFLAGAFGAAAFALVAIEGSLSEIAKNPRKTAKRNPAAGPERFHSHNPRKLAKAGDMPTFEEGGEDGKGGVVLGGEVWARRG